MQPFRRGENLHDTEAWGDYGAGPDDRISVQELFARTRQGAPVPRSGRVRPPDSIGFALNRSSFWMLCAGAVMAVFLVFLAGFLAGIGTTVSEVAQSGTATVAATTPAPAPQEPYPALPTPALPSAPAAGEPPPPANIDPRFADLGPPPARQSVPAVPLGSGKAGQITGSPMAEEALPQAAPVTSQPVPPSGISAPPRPQNLQLPPATRDAPAPARPAVSPPQERADLPASPTRVAPASPAPQAAEARAAGAWVLQFGAFRARENAQRLATSLEGRANGARVEQATGPNGQALFYVRAGGYSDRAAAEAEAARLRAAHGLEAFVTRR